MGYCGNFQNRLNQVSICESHVEDTRGGFRGSGQGLKFHSATGSLGDERPATVEVGF